MSLPQQQIGLKQYRKWSLNLWSLRFFNFNLSIAVIFVPIGLQQLKFLLGAGRMNCKMLFLKIARLSELLILLSRLFRLQWTGRTSSLKKLCLTLNLRILPILFLVLYAVLVVGILSKRYLGDWFLVILKKQQSVLNHRRWFKDYKPNSW